jgi:2-dehydropantoate 2-reductase
MEFDLAVVGPGAVGTFFAGHAAAAGRHVLSCARRPFTEYVVESETRPCHAPAHVVTDPTDASGPVAVVMVAVKSHHTDGAAPWLARLCGPDTVVVAAQNGIEAQERLAPYVNGAQVLQGVVYCAAELMAPGRTVHRGTGWIFLPPGPAAERVAALYEGLQAEIRVTPAHHTEAWRKLGLNAMSNGVTALTRKRFPVFADPRIAALAERVLAEAWAVGRADGADLDPAAAAGLAAMLASQGGDGSSSTYYDRMAGRPTEHDAIYGAVVRAAARLGVPAPLNEAIWALLAAGD